MGIDSELDFMADDAPFETQVELKAGKAATLCFTAQGIQCGLRAELQNLCVAVHDRCGNLASGVPAGTEVTLEPTAACEQAGVAAAKLSTPVGTASGGPIKQLLVEGTATFANVRVKAKHEGVYTARAVCSSRKLALEPALLQLTVMPSNAVTSVELSVSCVPSSCASVPQSPVALASIAPHMGGCECYVSRS